MFLVVHARELLQFGGRQSLLPTHGRHATGDRLAAHPVRRRHRFLERVTEVELAASALRSLGCHRELHQDALQTGHAAPPLSSGDLLGVTGAQAVGQRPVHEVTLRSVLFDGAESVEVEALALRNS